MELINQNVNLSQPLVENKPKRVFNYTYFKYFTTKEKFTYLIFTVLGLVILLALGIVLVKSLIEGISKGNVNFGFLDFILLGLAMIPVKYASNMRLEAWLRAPLEERELNKYLINQEQGFQKMFANTSSSFLKTGILGFIISLVALIAVLLLFYINFIW